MATLFMFWIAWEGTHKALLWTLTLTLLQALLLSDYRSYSMAFQTTNSSRSHTKVIKGIDHGAWVCIWVGQTSILVPVLLGDGRASTGLCVPSDVGVPKGRRICGVLLAI